MAAMVNRTIVVSGTKWEDIVGYARAVRVGNVVEVSGTTAVDEQGVVIGIKNPYKQTRFILSKIEIALLEAGATINDVIRSRIYVTDIRQWEKIGKAHKEVFKDIRPATSMVEVKSLINAELLVEIEVTAIINK